MNNLLNWFMAMRWRMSLSHCLEGLLIQIPIGLLTNFWIGSLCVVVWYWSREKCEHEFSIKGNASTATVWHKGWFPWEWGKYEMLDLAMPAASSFTIAILVAVIERLGR